MQFKGDAKDGKAIKFQYRKRYGLHAIVKQVTSDEH